MKETFSNLPLDSQIKKTDSSEKTTEYFDSINKQQLQFKASESDAVIGFFKSRGMQDSAANSVGFLFLKQCKLDDVDPLELLSNLQKLDGLTLDSTLGEILNINRIKTSTLGSAPEIRVDNPAKRNIVA